MFTTANNPYLLNIIPTFNVADPSGGASNNATSNAVVALETMIDTTNYIIRADAILPYNSDTVTIGSNTSIVGSFTVNGYTVGPSIDGSTIITGNSYIISTGNTAFSIVSTTTTSEPAISFITGGSTAFQIDSLGRALYDGDGVTSNVNRFWISSSILSADRAAVGFGPQSTMSTVFDVYKGDAYFDRNLNVNSNISCRTLVQFSDERLKRDIGPISGALSTLCELKGVHYTMDGRKQLGFIAQDIQRILPDAVYEIEGMLAVDYTRVIPLLVEAVKELARH
jgi:hypothetical protein